MKWEKITNITEIKSECSVYNFSCEPNHVYFANNILVHNCHKCAQAYFRWLINGINPMEYGLDANELAAKNVMIKRAIENYEKWVIKYRRIVPNEEFGYLHYLLNKGKLNHLPPKIEQFIKLFPEYKNLDKIIEVKTDSTIFVPIKFKPIFEFTNNKYIENGYKDFSKLNLHDKVHKIAEVYGFKEHIL